MPDEPEPVGIGHAHRAEIGRRKGKDLADPKALDGRCDPEDREQDPPVLGRHSRRHGCPGRGLRSGCGLRGQPWSRRGGVGAHRAKATGRRRSGVGRDGGRRSEVARWRGGARRRRHPSAACRAMAASSVRGAFWRSVRGRFRPQPHRGVSRACSGPRRPSAAWVRARIAPRTAPGESQPRPRPTMTRSTAEFAESAGELCPGVGSVSRDR